MEAHRHNVNQNMSRGEERERQTDRGREREGDRQSGRAASVWIGTFEDAQSCKNKNQP